MAPALQDEDDDMTEPLKPLHPTLPGRIPLAPTPETVEFLLTQALLRAKRQYPAEVPSVFTMQLSIPRFAS